jgi:D-alanine-D-alanine ligase
MRVAIVCNSPVSGRPDSEDVLEQVRLVSGALKALGHDFRVFQVGAVHEAPGGSALGANVAAPPSESPFFLLLGLKKYAPHAVFNLVEDNPAEQVFQHHYTALFELFDYHFTGSRYEAVLSTNDKAVSKFIMGIFNIPTPRHQVYRGVRQRLEVPFPCIIKPSREDASVGIEDSSVFHDEPPLWKALPHAYREHAGQPILIEGFVEGREFNVSLLETAEGEVEVLPVAEMAFVDWPAGKPRIVGYRAKWDAGSFEYRNTSRRFSPPEAPLDRLEQVSRKCWKVFNLRGYARVDLRVSGDGGIYVLEVNANPCISPDSGFVAALKEAGYSEADFVARALGAALRAEESSGEIRAPRTSKGGVRLRHELVPADPEAIRAVLAQTGVFSPREIGVALELAADRLAKGPASEYLFIMADNGTRTIGYICFGPITIAEGRFDIYWVAVSPDYTGRGIGRLLMREAEKAIAASGGRYIFIDTSSRKEYVEARRFYQRNGYVETARIRDFFSENDDKVVFMKRLAPPPALSHSGGREAERPGL